MKQQTDVLGARLYVAGFALAGSLPADAMSRVLQVVVATVGMDTAGMAPKIWTYPVLGDQGGVGETICQPLVESFIVSDAWPELAKTYIVLASCRPFNPQAVRVILAHEVGPILSMGCFEL